MTTSIGLRGIRPVCFQSAHGVMIYHLALFYKVLHVSLRFDPGNLADFKTKIQTIPGYPIGEDLPIREMVFESNAIWRLPDLLVKAGIQPSQSLLVVMDRTPMQREGNPLKELILQVLNDAAWQVDVIWLEPDRTGQVHTDFAQINFVKARLQTDSAVLSDRKSLFANVLSQN